MEITLPNSQADHSFRSVAGKRSNGRAVYLGDPRLALLGRSPVGVEKSALTTPCPVAAGSVFSGKVQGKPTVRNFRGGRGNPKLDRARRALLPYSAVHHSCPRGKKSGEEIREEIRCQFIILRNPVSVHHSLRNPVSVHHSEKSGVSSSFWKKSGVSSSFLPEKMNRHRITCGSTPDYVRLDTGLRAARRYYEALRLPDVPLAALRFLRLAIPSLRPSFVPDGPGHGAVDPPGVGKPGLRPAFRWRRQGLPSSRGTLVIIRHVLRPRWDQAG